MEHVKTQRFFFKIFFQETALKSKFTYFTFANFLSSSFSLTKKQTSMSEGNIFSPVKETVRY